MSCSSQRNIVKLRVRSFCTCTSHSELTLMQYCQNNFAFSLCHIRLGGFLLPCGLCRNSQGPQAGPQNRDAGEMEEKEWIKFGLHCVICKANTFLSLPLLPWKLLTHQQSAKFTFRRWPVNEFLEANDIFFKEVPLLAVMLRG